MQTRRTFLRSCAIASTAGALAGAGFVRAARANTDGAIAQLAGKMRGYVLVPTSRDYDDARRTFSFNPTTDDYPAAIAVCKSEDDVARALEFGRAQGLPIPVRGGGHDVLGASTVNRGIVIALAGLNGIEPDARAGRVTIGAGLRAGKVNQTLQPLNQAVALGCNPQVGIAGLTLGGGIGWLLGTAGAACDNLVRARLVTADSGIVTADEQSDSDIFWAIRGGGGNFGIATSLTFRTQAVANIVGGWIVYPGERLRDLLHLFRETMQTAPPELVVELLAFSASRPLAIAIVAYNGDAQSARRALAPLRESIAPLADDVALKPYAEFANPGPGANKLLQSPAPAAGAVPEKNDSPGIYWMGASMPALSDAAIDAILAALAHAPRGAAFSLGHYMHGALCEVPVEATPMLRAAGRMTFHFDTGWGNVKHAAECMRWVDAAVDSMKPFSQTPTYVNYLGSDAVAAVETTYGPHVARLRALKRRYDPDNVLRRNRNIPP